MRAFATVSRPESPLSDVHAKFIHVDKSFDQGTKVVDDLNLDVYRGEFLTLLGPSGSGKTTCLMMLAGFETPTAGDIQINGDPVQNIPPHKRNIGIVFQNYALFPHLSVAKNLSFPLEVRRFAKAEQREKVERALELVQLQGFGDRSPSQLSGGQQQRVAIARALVYEPDLVLMDEPLGALDRRLREEMQFEIRRIQKQVGVTMVYVTHDQQEAMVLSDRIAVFEQGKIQQLAPPESLYEEPTEVFVSGFFGENNKLTGDLDSIVEDLDICNVVVNSQTIQAVPIGDLETGATVNVVIRPERVQILWDDEERTNEFDAEVKDIVFLGDHLRVLVDVLGKQDFLIKIPNTAGHGRILPGDRVRIGWAQLDCRAIKPKD